MQLGNRFIYEIKARIPAAKKAAKEREKAAKAYRPKMKAAMLKYIKGLYRGYLVPAVVGQITLGTVDEIGRAYNGVDVRVPKRGGKGAYDSSFLYEKHPELKSLRQKLEDIEACPEGMSTPCKLLALIQSPNEINRFKKYARSRYTKEATAAALTDAQFKALVSDYLESFKSCRL